MVDTFTNISRMTKIDLSRQVEVLTGPILFALDVTNKCNLKCLHCFNRSGGRYPRQELTDAELLDVIRQIYDLKPMVVCFCGGEPLLRGKLIYQAMDLLARGQVSVNMVSNGYFVTKEVAHRLKQAGVSFIQISVDGSQSTSHDRLRGLNGSFHKALGAIEYLKAQEIRVGVAFVPTKFNIYEFPDYVEQMREMGINEVHIQPLMPLGECLNHVEELLPTEEQYRWVVEVIQTLPKDTERDFSVEWADPIEHFIRFGQLQRRVNLYADVSSDGFLRVSPYLPLHVGQLRRHTLKEYWEAGYKIIWNYDFVQRFASKVKSVNDLMRVEPSPYYGPSLYIDLIDDRPAVSGGLVADPGEKGGVDEPRRHATVQ